MKAPGIFALLLTIFVAGTASAECIPFSEARRHIGERTCITGKVLRIQTGRRGVHYLDFCEDYRTCPFSVVIFASDLRQVGDIRLLEGKVAEIHGSIKGYDGRAEIILKDISQLGGESARIPKLPKNYDVENQGRYSAGMLVRPSQPKTSHPKRQTASLPITVPNDEGPAGSSDN